MWPFKRHDDPPPRIFTGNCMVRQHTGDGVYVGPCWHSTYNGVCPTHGDVSIYLAWDKFSPWPKDYELSRYEDLA